MLCYDNDDGDYQVLKENLLTRFRLTVGGYRMRFQQREIENGETPESSLIDSGGIYRSGAKWRV